MSAAPPALLVAATHSGAGKTTAVGVIVRALRARGASVQTFKLGPDFIDAAYHVEASDRPAINLDLWMQGEEGVVESFRRWSRGADVSVVEAMGALFDGENGTHRGSAAHVAKLLDIPVIVVLDVWGMTRTAGALLKGLRRFDPDLRIAGCVLNRVGSATHAAMVVDALTAHLRPLVVGTIRHDQDLVIPERHLGLLTVEENRATRATREEACRRAAATLHVDRIASIAGMDGDRTVVSVPSPVPQRSPARSARRRRRLALARDDAFCFYYTENLLLLEDAGFEIVPFRPTVDASLPCDVDAIYLGGGYPESFADALSANVALAAELRARRDNGTPIYAECGGLVYAARSLTGFDGVRHEMAGLLPIDVVMDPEHLAIDYVSVQTLTPTPLGPSGTVARGHEFHRSRIVRSDLEPNLYDLTTSRGTRRRDGFAVDNVVASYVHLHFGSNPRVVEHLANAAGSS
ncbi:MAG TPA: cobyrinate a,c-diamide synthase [Acidimicrobiales bacterium]